MEKVMKHSVIIAAIALAGSLLAQSANAQPLHHARGSGCRQHAVLVTPNAPALVQQIMNPFLVDPRLRCMPIYHATDDVAWPVGSSSIAP